MRITIADSRVDVIEGVINLNSPTGLSALVSYWYCFANGKPTSIVKRLAKTVEPIRNRNFRLYLDSGVFSARKHGIVIPVDELIRFCHNYRNVFDYVFNMDEGTHDEQLYNCVKMKKAGLPVIGIFHGDMTIDYLHKMIDICEGYVAVSFFKTGKQTGKASLENLDRVFNAIITRYGTNPLKKVHGLGIEAPQLLTRYPFYSVDSTSAKSNYAFGKVSEFDPVTGTIKAHKPKSHEHAVDIMRRAGTKTMECFKHDTSGVKARVHQSIMEREKYNQFINDLWDKRKVKF